MKKSIVILLCIATLVTTGCGKVPVLQDGKDAVVTFTDGNISADDFYKQLKNKYGRDVLIEMVDSTLLNTKYPDDKEFEKKVNSQVDLFKEQTGADFLATIKYYYGLNSEEELRDFIAMSYKQEKLVEEYVKKAITEDEIKKFYDKEIYGDITASHILIEPDVEDKASDEEKKKAEEKALEEAKKVIERLNNGEDFATLAKELSDDTGTKEDGGSVGEYNIDSNLVDEFKLGGRDLEVGKYTTTPVKSSFGYHIILKVSQKEKPAMDTVKSVIEDIIYENTLEEDSKITGKTLEKFRTDMGVDIHDDKLLEQYKDLMKDLTK